MISLRLSRETRGKRHRWSNVSNIEPRRADTDARGLPLAKGPTRKQLKARAKRQESAVATKVRETVDLRDGYCRLALAQVQFGQCAGPSTWAHLTRRSATRGMAPEQRHSTETSVKLCTRHHEMEERHRIRHEAMTLRGADGPLRWVGERETYEEPA